MGTWSGDDGALHDIEDSSDGFDCEERSVTAFDILKELSIRGKGGSCDSTKSPTLPGSPASPGCRSPTDPSSGDLIDPEFEREFDAIIQQVSPTVESKAYRAQVYGLVAELLKEQEGCIEVCAFGSVPLETYLPDGDIDICAFFTCEASVGLTAVHHMLQREAETDGFLASYGSWLNEPKIGNDPQLVFAGVPVVKCVIGGIPVDISANQVRGLSAVCFLNSVDRSISANLMGLAPKHIFKISIIAVKVWCGYESRILGSQGGLLPSYAVEILVLNILNRYVECTTPAAVLYKFLEYYANFNWEECMLGLQPSAVQDECMLYRSDLDGTQDVFAPKFMNIIDPLDKANNLGRSVNQASAMRTQHAFKLGVQSMRYHMSQGGAHGARKFLQATSRLLNTQFKSRPDVGDGSWQELMPHSLHFDLKSQHNKLEELKAKFMSGGVETIMPAVPMGRVMGRALHSWRLSLSEIPTPATSALASPAGTPETPSAPNGPAGFASLEGIGWEDTPTKASPSWGQGGLVVGHLQARELDAASDLSSDSHLRSKRSSFDRGGHALWNSSKGHHMHIRYPHKTASASLQEVNNDVHNEAQWPGLGGSGSSHTAPSTSPEDISTKSVEPAPAENATKSEPAGTSWAALASGRKATPKLEAPASAPAVKNAWAGGSLATKLGGAARQQVKQREGNRGDSKQPVWTQSRDHREQHNDSRSHDNKRGGKNSGHGARRGHDSRQQKSDGQPDGDGWVTEVGKKKRSQHHHR